MQKLIVHLLPACQVVRRARIGERATRFVVKEKFCRRHLFVFYNTYSVLTFCFLEHTPSSFDPACPLTLVIPFLRVLPSNSQTPPALGALFNYETQCTFHLYQRAHPTPQQQPYEHEVETRSRQESRSHSYVHEMTGKNACSVVDGDKRYQIWEKADYRYSLRDCSCTKGEDKPKYQLEAFRVMSQVLNKL